VWSVGCFIAEMFIGKPLFPGRSDLEQLPCIFERLGVPTEESWKNVTQYKPFAEAESVHRKRKTQDPNYGREDLKAYLTNIRISS